MWDLLLAFHAYIRQAEIYGKESNIYIVAGEMPEGADDQVECEQQLCLKLHRLGRTCFRYFSVCLTRSRSLLLRVVLNDDFTERYGKSETITRAGSR